MMLQNDETKTDSILVEPKESAVEESIETEQADAIGSDASNERPAEVEEIRRDEAPTGKTQSKKHIAEKKEDPNPLLLDPYEFDQCTITIMYTRVGDQQASVSVHNHKDDPIVKTFPLAEVLLPEPIEGVIQKLLEIWPDGKVSATMVLLPTEGDAERRMVVSIRAGNDTPIVQSGPASEYPLPAPITAMLNELKELLPARAMKKIEKEAKEKSRTATSKTTPATKPAPVTKDGKTQMSLF
jgi:hypothetical protein